MKKFFSLILALSICVSLCACGKSDEAAAVDEMILAIGEVSIDNISAVEDASRAYDLLSEKDRKSIEYYNVLVEAKEAAQKVQDEFVFSELNRLVNELEIVYDSCVYVVDGVSTIWDNVGADQFWAVYKSVLKLNLGYSKAEYDKLFVAASGVKANATIWAAAYGLCPEYSKNGLYMTDKENQKTLDICHAYNNHYQLIVEKMDPLAEEVKAFRNEYKDKFESEVNALNELCLEINMYVSFALEPSGNLNSYNSSDKTYQNNIDRLIKTINSLI